ncbi:MAG: hypothetical protein KC591_15815, partial [Gemmatimonadetes bacterium]|nr:hypothetical protein [Gemmatimonadota bacterium]
ESLYAAIPTEGDGDREFRTPELRLRELREALREAEAERNRAVAEAVKRTKAETERAFEQRLGAASRALETAGRKLAETAAVEMEIAVVEVLTLATAVAGKIVRREIRQDDEFAQRLVRRCLRRIASRAEVRVRLHPDDVAAIEQAGESLLSDVGIAHVLRFEADRRVERGGCVVETPDFVVDGRPRTQLGLAREAMEAEA